jgi:hypothetical protein
MKTAARVILIVGLVLGLLGGIGRLFPIVFADMLRTSVQSNKARLPENLRQAEEALAKATDQSLLHVLEVAGFIVVAAAGGSLGLLSLASDTGKTGRIIFSVAAMAAGLGMIAFRSWVAAALLIVGGFLSLLSADQKPGQSGGG